MTGKLQLKGEMTIHLYDLHAITLSDLSWVASEMFEAGPFRKKNL